MTATEGLRHSTLKSKEAALLAGELSAPSWQSRNEGIHERVSFEDAIWGFDLAGGAYYKTPLRVTGVKAGSRAEKAGIRPGDKLLRINDIETATLTIQEAHQMILESGIHIKLAVTAPEDTEDSYHCWQDQLEHDLAEGERLRLEENDRLRRKQIRCKVSSNWSLQWPWVSKRRIIYKESNCYMVPSKYESKHGDKLLPISETGDIKLYSKDGENEDSDGKKNNDKSESSDEELSSKSTLSELDKEVSAENSTPEPPQENGIISNGIESNGINEDINGNELSKTASEHADDDQNLMTTGDAEEPIENGFDEIYEDGANSENGMPNEIDNAINETNGYDDIIDEILDDSTEAIEANEEVPSEMSCNGTEETTSNMDADER